MLIILLFAISWGVYTANKKQPEFITIISILFFSIYYVLGFYLYGPEYFPYEEQKKYAMNIVLPIILASIFFASVIGNLLFIPFKNCRPIRSPAVMSFRGVYFLIGLYILIFSIFLFNSNFGIFSSSEGVSDNINIRTNLVYENKFYSHVSYGVFFVLPFLALLLIERKKSIIAYLILLISAFIIGITGQKSSLVIVLLTLFFYFLIDKGLFKSIKYSFMPSILVIFAMLAIVIIWNKDSLTYGVLVNLKLAFLGVTERVFLVGAQLVTEYIYVSDNLDVDLQNIPDGKVVSMYIYDLIENDGLKGTKPIHLSFELYLEHSLLYIFIVTFFLYLLLYVFKVYVDTCLSVYGFAKAINAWILVLIVNMTITNSYLFLTAWLFSIMMIMGCIVFFGNLSALFEVERKLNLLSRHIAVNFVFVFVFVYFLQGFVRSFL